MHRLAASLEWLLKTCAFKSNVHGDSHADLFVLTAYIEEKVGDGVTVGVVVGAVLLVAGVATGCVLYRRRRQPGLSTLYYNYISVVVSQCFYL